MSGGVDLALDDIIAKGRKEKGAKAPAPGGRAANGAGGYGPVRRTPGRAAAGVWRGAASVATAAAAAAASAAQPTGGRQPRASARAPVAGRIDVDLSLEDLIAKERSVKVGKASGTRAGANGASSAGPVRGRGRVASGAAGRRASSLASAAAAAAKQPAVPGKPPPAGLEELREMDAFGSFRRRMVMARGGGGNGYGGGWRDDDRGTVKGGGKSAGRTRVVRSEPYGGGASRPRGGGAAWERDAGPSARWSDGGGYGGSPPSSRRVFVGGLNYDVMGEDLEELFAQYGVQKAWINYDSADRSLGSGGAIFVEPDAAVAACRRFHGRVIDGQTIHMELDVSTGKGKGKGKGKARGRDW